jgi:hypothetical protein
MNGVYIALGMLCGLVTPALSAAGNVGLPPSIGTSSLDSTSGTAGNLHDFNIPAQPLDTALNRYADLTDRPTLYSSKIVVNRTSSAVRGRYSNEAALHLLLEGTGLIAEKLDSGMGETFRLEESGAPVAKGATDRARLFAAGGYPGLVQERIWQALCANPVTAPGSYNALFRFQVDAAGHIERAHLIGSTNDAHRDAVILDAVRQVHLAPPPALAPQTLTMLLESGVGPPCDEERF